MISNFKLLALFLLFNLIAAQPPRLNGIDKDFFTPLEPGRGRLRSEGAESEDPDGPAIASTESGDEPMTTPEIPEEPAAPSTSPAPCRKLRIRSLDGRCTHRKDGTLGQARRVHFSYFNVDSRILGGDGLKSPRVISNIVSDQDGNVFNNRDLSELVVFFGQFLDHNLVATPLSDEEADIPPPEGSDEHLPFRRSLRGMTGDGDAERPINTLTSIADLVAVYGPNELRNQALRVPGSCKLKTSPGDLLPFNTLSFNNAPSTSRLFYFAGDHRANEHPVLTSLHTLWVREHNRICDVLSSRSPFSLFPTNRLYDAARSINIAQFQKVVYEEFFPAVTGRLLPRYRGFRGVYNPTLSSVFSTAAFRVGHTMVGDVVTKINDEGGVSATPLKDNFFQVGNVRDGIEPFLRGAAQVKAQEIDIMVVDSLRNFLFEDTPEEEGPDLIALNLQRSRDHNIPSFNDVRSNKEFKLPRAKTFSDISSDPDVQAKLAAAYDHVDDVEAWVGMMAEDKMERSSMGETLFKVWRREFVRLAHGDQFFYLRKKSLPYLRSLRRFAPELVNPLRKPRVKIFRDILLRNTELSKEDLNNDVFFTGK